MGDTDIGVTTTRWPELALNLYPNHPELISTVAAMLGRHDLEPVPTTQPWSERDAWIITYADQFQTHAMPPLASLHTFYNRHLRPWINGIHLLPFYPWSSDDGYSILDYHQVDPRYGTWADVESIAAESRLMFDAVINHVSAGSAWFLGYLAGDPTYRDFFLSVDPDTDLSHVVRPRTSPLLTRFDSKDGPVWLWTTFSSDQIDLNYGSGDVFVAILDVLLDYARHGASMIRLDAVQFLWKEPGQSSINMRRSHQTVQLLRACMDVAYPNIVFVTETNVPHAENISYFGDDSREAQMVYQFALPPLVLDALHNGDVAILANWLRDLDPLPPGSTYLNFLSSHDGVGVRPVEGILPPNRVEELVALNIRGGGQVGVRSVGQTTAPYELNTTWFTLMETGYSTSEAIDRHLAAHAIMLALRGVPAIYALSLVGGRSDQAGYASTGRGRSLNRARLATESIETDLADPSSVPARTMSRLEEMLRWRASTPAFHPDASQNVLDTPAGILGIEREAASQLARVYINVTSRAVEITRPDPGWSEFDPAASPAAATITVGPWQSVWLRKDE